MPKLKVYLNPENNLSVNIEGMGVYVAEQEYAKLKVENKNQAELLQKLGEHNLSLQVEKQQLLTALQRIALWDEHDVKTRVDIGSLGEQRHYRAIAADAVLGQPCNVTAIKMKAVDDFTGWLANAPYFKAMRYEVTEIYRYSAQYLSDLGKADSNSVGKSAEGGENES